MRMRLTLALMLLLAPVQAQTPVAHPGDWLRWEQAIDPVHDYTHFYSCFEAETFCERVEKLAGFVDADTPPGYTSFKRQLPAFPLDGAHTALLWVYGVLPEYAYTTLDFTYDSTPTPNPPPSSVIQAPHGTRIWRPTT